MTRIIFYNLLNNRYFNFICIIALFIKTANAQYDPQFTQYQHNTIAINPAFSGSLGQPIITAIERAQWGGVTGAPHTQSLSFHTPMKIRGLGVGVNIINDAIGPLNEVYFDIMASYAVIFSNDTRLAFGLKQGARHFRVDKNKINLEDSSDIRLQRNINTIFMNTGAGLYFNSERFYLGVSIPNLLPNRIYSGGIFNGNIIDTNYQFFTITGYVFDLNPTTRFKPAMLMRITQGSPVSVDTSANFLLNDRTHLGVSYRFKDSFSFSAGFDVNKKIFVGYSYDLTTTQFRISNLGSHEIVVKLKGRNTNRDASRFKCESGGLAWF